MGATDINKDVFDVPKKPFFLLMDLISRLLCTVCTYALVYVQMSTAILGSPQVVCSEASGSGAVRERGCDCEGAIIDGSRVRRPLTRRTVNLGDIPRGGGFPTKYYVLVITGIIS